MSSISLRFSQPVATDRTTVVVCPDLSRPDRGLEASRAYRLSAYGALMAAGTDAAIAVVDQVFSLIPSAAVRTEAAATAFVGSVFSRLDPAEPLALVWIVGTHAYAASTDSDAFSISILAPSGATTRLGISPLRADSATAYRGSVITLECDGAKASAGIVEGPSPRIAITPKAAPQPDRSDQSDQSDQPVIIWDDAEPSESPESPEPSASPEQHEAPAPKKRRRAWIWICAAIAVIAVVILNIPTCGDPAATGEPVPTDTIPAPAPTAAADSAAVPTEAAPADTTAQATADKPAAAAPAASTPTPAPTAAAPSPAPAPAADAEADDAPAPAPSGHKNFNISPEIEPED